MPEILPLSMTALCGMANQCSSSLDREHQSYSCTDASYCSYPVICTSLFFVCMAEAWSLVRLGQALRAAAAVQLPGWLMHVLCMATWLGNVPEDVRWKQGSLTASAEIS